MRTSRRIASALLGLAGVALFVAGPVMVYEGFHGQAQIRHELAAQKIVFPAKGSTGLPRDLQSYGGQQVTTGPQAKAYADMVEEHVQAATGGRTYSQVSAAYMASGGKDATLGQLRQTAFMGESLRGSLMGAYQAWELSWLVVGLGALFFGLGFAVAATAWALRPARVKVPESPEVLQHKEVITS
ncbi:MAG TPA: hypothetical protein VJT31_02790 [Rugosimonospora sp.]|nr:hypothetical protein [Rugosimonospora sp.]